MRNECSSVRFSVLSVVAVTTSNLKVESDDLGSDSSRPLNSVWKIVSASWPLILLGPWMIWLVWASEFPMMLWSLTQNPVQLTIAEVETQGRLPSQLNLSLSEIRPATDNCFPVLRPDDPNNEVAGFFLCLLYTSPSPRDRTRSRMPSSA